VLFNGYIILVQASLTSSYLEKLTDIIDKT
jgi:hypothetical protein